MQELQQSQWYQLEKQRAFCHNASFKSSRRFGFLYLETFSTATSLCLTSNNMNSICPGNGDAASFLFNMGGFLQGCPHTPQATWRRTAQYSLRKVSKQSLKEVMKSHFSVSCFSSVAPLKKTYRRDNVLQ